MSMEDGLSKARLVKIAKRWGKQNPERAVGQAVEQGLISKAIPRGRGRARGQDYWYPPDTGRSLGASYRLRKLGCRGNNLHFAMWWVGAMEHTPEVSEYVASVFAFAPALAKSRLSTLAERAGGDFSQLSSETKSSDDLTLTDLFANEIENLLASKFGFITRQLIKIIDPAIAMVTDQELLEIIVMFSASSLELHPEEQEEPIRPLVEYVLSDEKDESVYKVTHQQLEEFRTPEGFERFVSQLRDVKGPAYDIVRTMLKESREPREFVRSTAKLTRQIRRFVPKRLRKRVGPWFHTGLAVRALTVGIVLWTAGIMKEAAVSELE